MGWDRAEREGNAVQVLQSRDDVIASALLRATDATDEAWVVFEAVRDRAGVLVDLRVLHGNPAYWELSGMDSATAVGRPVIEVMPRIDWTQGLAKLFFDAMASGRSFIEPHASTAPQSGPLAGQVRNFELRLTVADDVLTARLRDITARAVAEAELATSLARFEALFEQAPIAMVTVSPERKIRLNRAAIALYGRDSEEMSRLTFSVDAPWIPDDQAERWAEMRRQVAAGEEVHGTRFALIRSDGNRRQLELSSIPIVTRDGARDGVVTVLIDLTDRLSLEAQYRQAQKMEALGRFAGGIAHDFNNVLMAMLGYGEMVADDLHDVGTADPEHADQIVAATRRAIELTARLTTFVRHEPARSEPLDVAELIESVLPLIKRLAPESIEIATHLEPGSIVVLDRSEFEQVLFNLVVNAVDAMPDGGRLTIEVQGVDHNEDRALTHLGEAAGRHVMVAVSDTGIGMNEQTRSRIFEPFYTTKPVGEGTGLGLAMAFGAVERAGGRIWVYSEPGRGTTFKIYLPPAETEAAPIDGTGEAGPLRGGAETILVLEDDAQVRDLLVTVLRGLGYQVTVAGLPSEAIAAAKNHRFDLLVSDVVMPEMTGNALAAQLRVSQPDLPVIFMSGYTPRALDFKLGPLDNLVSKPLGPSEIARTVREALDRAR